MDHESAGSDEPPAAADGHRRLAEEHEQIAEHWATRGHLKHAAEHRQAANEEREVAEAVGSSPLPEMGARIEQLRDAGR